MSDHQLNARLAAALGWLEGDPPRVFDRGADLALRTDGPGGWSVVGWDPAGSIADAWQVVEELKRRSFSFGCWDVPVISSAQHGAVAAFIRSLRPPSEQNWQRCHYGNAPGMAEAIVKAALAALCTPAAGGAAAGCAPAFGEIKPDE